MVPGWAIIRGKRRSSFLACVVVLLGLVAVNFSSRSAPHHVDTWQTPIDSEKAVPRLPRKPPRSSVSKESPLQVGFSSASIQVDESNSADPSDHSDETAACCCYTQQNVSTINVYQEEDEKDPMKVLEFDADSFSYSPSLVTNDFGEEGVEVVYRLVKQGVPDAENSPSKKGSSGEWKETFIPLSMLPKSKCPRSSRVRLYVEAESFEGRVDAENCVWKEYGCGRMRRRQKSDPDKCEDGKTIFAEKSALDGFWLTKDGPGGSSNFCEQRINPALVQAPGKPQSDTTELKSSVYPVKEHMLVFALLAMLWQ